MSRSNYSEDIDQFELECYRQHVNRAINGRRGQQFLRLLRDALDAMPEKELIAESFVDHGNRVCALGAAYLAKYHRAPTNTETDTIASDLNIAESMAREIMFLNDDDFDHDYLSHKDENQNPIPHDIRVRRHRWTRVRRWIDEHLLPTTT